MLRKCAIFSQISTTNAPTTYLFELFRTDDMKINQKWLIFFIAKKVIQSQKERMVFKMQIIKEELRFDDSLKKRLEFICDFSKVTPTFINGSIRKIQNYERENSCRILDHIGTQCHTSINDIEGLRQSIEELQQFGLPIDITELDISKGLDGVDYEIRQNCSEILRISAILPRLLKKYILIFSAYVIMNFC